MTDHENTTEQKTPATASEPAKEVMEQVLTRFTRGELDYMKDDTGATADATAVACFARKNMPPEIRARG